MIIGVLDSGLGGLTTLKEMIKAKVSDNFIYYADNLNAPYGSKSKEEIERCVKDSCDFLLKRGAEALVLACNTATSSVINKLRRELNIPVFGLEPAIRPALEGATEPVLVLATEYTLKGEKWRELTELFSGEYRIKPLPRLASLIDCFYPETQIIEEYLQHELADFCNAGRVVLGCTHYILVKDSIKKTIPNAVTFDGNVGLSKLLSRLFYSPARSIDVDIEFSGEKEYARYAEILGALVEHS